MVVMSIRYSIAALRGIGRSTAQSIADERRRGPFLSVGDFVCRVAVNKAEFVALAKSGAFDTLDTHRASLVANANVWVAFGRRQRENADNGTQDLFG